MIAPRSRRAALLAALVALPLLAAPTLRAQAPATAQSAAAAPTTIILVRHAEKAAEPARDPELSLAGVERAEAIRHLLRDAGVSALVTTQFQRTRQTAAPLAAALGLTPEVVPASGDVPAHARQVADHVLSRHAGRTVVVVGHSNTILAIANALGAGPAADIDERDYDHVIVVVRPATGPATRVVLRTDPPAPR